MEQKEIRIIFKLGKKNKKVKNILKNLFSICGLF